MSIYLVDAFTATPFSGNRAGVVLNGEKFSQTLKQQIAAEINASETAFAAQIAPDVFRAEYFTPTTQIDFCGHATVALFHTLASTGLIGLNDGSANLLVETKAGTFPISVTESGKHILVTMSQTSAHFAAPPCSLKTLASALNLPEEAIDTRFPIALAKTGNWHLIVGLKSRTQLNAIEYDTAALSNILNECRAVTAHVFFQESETVFHARNFGPTIGIPEDAATGSAAGAFGAYLVHEGLIGEGKQKLSITQGEKMGRPSQIFVSVDSNNRKLKQVDISGTAVRSFTLAMD